MTIDALKYIVLGSVITLAAVLLVYALNASVNPSLLSSAYVLPCNNETLDNRKTISNPPISEIEAVTRTPATSSKTLPIDTGNNTAEKNDNENNCNAACLNALTEKLTQHVDLDESDIDNLVEYAQQIAFTLSKQPEQIANLESSLTSQQDEHSRDAIIFLLSKLPQEQLLQSARHLNTSSNTADRIASLNLLEAAIGVDPSINGELNLLISTETNKDVLLNAISIINELDPKQVNSNTRSKLSNLIKSSDNDKLKKAALLAQTSATLNDEDIRNDIGNILKSSSTDLKFTGLQALDKVLLRQKLSPERGSWKTDIEFKNQVNIIANSATENIGLRIEALNLIRRHFSDKSTN